MTALDRIVRDPVRWAAALIARVDGRRPHRAMTEDEALADVEDLLDGALAVWTAHERIDPAADGMGRLIGAARMRLDGLRAALRIEHRGGSR